MEQIAAEGYSVQIMDIDLDRMSAQKYSIRSVPTVVIEEDGNEIKRFVGAQPKNVITESLS
jgi:thioredoxin 1